MNSTLRSPLLTALLAMVASVTLVACDKTDPATPGQHVDAAIADVKLATEKAQVEVNTAAKDTQAAATDAANALSQGVSDATITAKIKAALAADDKLSALRIDVDTVQGKVTLTGTAPDLSSKERANTLASAVTGVTDVRNQLVVSGQS